VTYKIVVQPAARAEAAGIYKYLHERSPQAAERWLTGFHQAARTLESLPERCAHAPENRSFKREIRQLLYEQYRILFTIQGRTVRVLHVRHGAQLPLGTRGGE
jgi:plasmid stabilization system protein ParE